MFLNIIIEKPIQLVTVGQCRVTVSVGHQCPSGQK